MNPLEPALALDRLLAQARLHRGRALPVAIGVLGDFRGQVSEAREPLLERRFVPVHLTALDALVAALRPRVVVEVDDDGAVLGLDLTMHRLADFGPAGLVAQAAPLRALADAAAASPAAAARLARLIDRVLHHPAFQALESSWRGLEALLRATEAQQAIVVKVFEVTPAELARNLRRYRGVSWDQSPLFRKLYDDELGSFGGEPFALLVLDAEVADSPAELETLELLAQIGAAVRAPFVASVAPALFHQAQFADVAQLRSVDGLLRGGGHRGLGALRETPDAAWLAFALPRVLARPPWRRQRIAAAPIVHDESVTAPGELLRTRAGYALAARLAITLARAEANGAAEALSDAGSPGPLPLLGAADAARLAVPPGAPDTRLRPALRDELRAAGFNVLAEADAPDRPRFAPVRAFADATPLPQRLVTARLMHRLHALVFQARGGTARTSAPATALQRVARAFPAATGEERWPSVPDLPQATLRLEAVTPASVRMHLRYVVPSPWPGAADEVCTLVVEPGTDDESALPGRWIVEDGGTG